MSLPQVHASVDPKPVGKTEAAQRYPNDKATFEAFAAILLHVEAVASKESVLDRKILKLASKWSELCLNDLDSAAQIIWVFKRWPWGWRLRWLYHVYGRSIWATTCEEIRCQVASFLDMEWTPLRYSSESTFVARDDAYERDPAFIRLGDYLTFGYAEGPEDQASTSSQFPEITEEERLAAEIAWNTIFEGLPEDLESVVTYLVNCANDPLAESGDAVAPFSEASWVSEPEETIDPADSSSLVNALDIAAALVPYIEENYSEEVINEHSTSIHFWLLQEGDSEASENQALAAIQDDRLQGTATPQGVFNIQLEEGPGETATPTVTTSPRQVEKQPAREDINEAALAPPAQPASTSTAPPASSRRAGKKRAREDINEDAPRPVASRKNNSSASSSRAKSGEGSSTGRSKKQRTGEIMQFSFVDMTATVAVGASQEANQTHSFSIGHGGANGHAQYVCCPWMVGKSKRRRCGAVVHWINDASWIQHLKEDHEVGAGLTKTDPCRCMRSNKGKDGKPAKNSTKPMVYCSVSVKNLISHFLDSHIAPGADSRICGGPDCKAGPMEKENYQNFCSAECEAKFDAVVAEFKAAKENTEAAAKTA
ncbi:hypothetical protein D9611_009012 [Ephemerocybe angulata]|uniref:Uncharacterized protein n=1 Tax=Ephemerocybe angulata TaxID=980116 RepID=A0A8H5BZH3_9AGAR|nr:hypothetical protein D9611_009012 [Tulosesus angulatus]